MRASLVHIFTATALLAPCLPAQASVATWADAIDNAFRRSDRPPPLRNMELDRAAQAACEAGDDIDIRRLIRALGVPDGLLVPMVVVAPDDRAVRREWLGYIREHVVPQGVSHYGMFEEGGRLAVVFARRLFHPVALPIAPSSGDVVKIEGDLAPGLAVPQVYIAGPSELVTTVPVGQFGRYATFQIPLDEGPGSYWVELVALTDRGREVVALFPITTEGAPLAPVVIGRERPVAPEARLASDRALGLLNLERERLGLSKLRLDRNLKHTATVHAGSMSRAGVVAHVLPGGEPPDVRLAHSGVVSDLFYENLALADSVEACHEQLWASPSHRRALLDERLNAVGIGVRSVEADGGRLLYDVHHLARL